MQNEKPFVYQYQGGQQEKDAELRKRYHLPEDTEVTDAIRAAPDREIRWAEIRSVLLGNVFLLIFGAGLSLVILTTEPLSRIAGIVLGLIGIAGMTCMPMLFQKLRERKRRQNETSLHRGEHL